MIVRLYIAYTAGVANNSFLNRFIASHLVIFSQSVGGINLCITITVDDKRPGLISILLQRQHQVHTVVQFLFVLLLFGSIPDLCQVPDRQIEPAPPQSATAKYPTDIVIAG